MYVNALGHAEELELVIGVGCLAWTPADHPTVLRHLLTASVTIEFDDDTGRLAVVSAESVEAADVEVEMLDARLITQPQQLNESRARARLRGQPAGPDTGRRYRPADCARPFPRR